MADGDYERGRDRELAGIAARLRRMAAERKAPRVLVLNGWAASEAAWGLCAFRRERVFSYIEQLDGEVERTLADNPQARFVLVGWSMGGSYALKVACEHPDRVAGLVLLAATPRMMEDREGGWRGMNARRLEALRKGLELTQGQGFFGPQEGRPNPYLLDAEENLERGLRYLLDTDLRAQVEHADFHFPIFGFQSEHDGIVRAENAAYLRQVFPQMKLTLVPGGEHALPVLIPKEIDHAVDACLAVAAKG